MQNLRLLGFAPRIRIVAVLLRVVNVAHAQSSADAGWPNYGNDPGDSQVTSAPAIVRALVITGSSSDNRAVSVERGIVRAYDSRTGQLRWSFDPVPWALKTNPRTGAGNAWSTL